jgi:protein-S-isoprenylcysteine O-methyltransferase Ste14
MKFRFLYWIFLFLSVIFAGIVTESNMPFYIRILGVVFIIYGVVLNFLAGKTLKKYAHKTKTQGFSVPDKFTKEGIFACMRHPGQFGNMFLMVGVGIVSGSWYALAYSGWAVFFGALFILYVEEKEAIEKYGSEYCEYIKTTPPFKISLECIKKAFKAI